VVANFSGEVLSEFSLPVRIDHMPIDVIADLVEDGVRACVMDTGLTLSEIDMICLGIPGVVEHRTGVVRSSPIFSDENVDFAAVMSPRFGIRTIVESDVHAVTLAHHWFGKARHLDDMVLISLERSLGLGVLHNRELFRGAGGLSHNLGDLVLGSSADGISRLASLAGESAILGEGPRGGLYADAIRLGRGISHAQTLIAAKDTQIISAAERAGEAVGVTVANIVTLFAPPRVILVGASLALGKPFIDRLTEGFNCAIPPSLADVSELVFDDADDFFWARGAAAVALYELYESPWSTTGPAL